MWESVLDSTCWQDVPWVGRGWMGLCLRLLWLSLSVPARKRFHKGSVRIILSQFLIFLMRQFSINQCSYHLYCKHQQVSLNHPVEIKVEWLTSCILQLVSMPSLKKRWVVFKSWNDFLVFDSSSSVSSVSFLSFSYSDTSGETSVFG